MDTPGHTRQQSHLARMRRPTVVAASGAGWARYEKIVESQGAADCDTPERRAVEARLAKRIAAAEAAGDKRRADKLRRRVAAA